MKTPRFWYPAKNDKTAELVAAALSPLSWLFAGGTFVRRLFTRPRRARVPILCIGNVVAGGAGKTPTALALARVTARTWPTSRLCHAAVMAAMANLCAST